MLKRPGIRTLALLVLSAQNLWAIESVPMLRIEGLGGQIFFKAPDGKNTSFSGLADWLAADGIGLSENDTLVPTVNGQYLHRTQVTQIGGGGQLTNETLDNSATLRWAHAFDSSWSLKPNIGYRNEMITVSAGEHLGAGLFDYHKYSVGFDLERKGERLKSLAQSLSAYRTNFYHYQASRSPLFGLELLSSDRALDFDSYDYSIAADYALPDEFLLNASAQGSYRDFRHQRIVEPTVFDSKTRKDIFGGGVMGIQRAAPPLPASIDGRWALNAGYFLLASNQNNFDAGQLKFNPDFYTYWEYSVSPSWSMKGSGGWNSMLSYSFTRRDYRDRPVQHSDGTYAGGKAYTNTHAVSGTLTYPLGHGFAANAVAAYTAVNSNTRYETYYRYNYSYEYYFMGFSYSL